ncbi:MAG: heme exporter protein CcmB, partial [Pseudomonadota bacterium]|nr:heme exporter protein CcmB [Pseudomonadota bacterium]
MSDWRILQALFARELRLVLRGGHLMPVLAFVFICVMLMPFGLGPELSLLQRLAPGLLWVIMLMAVLLSLDRMFQADFEDGGLDQLMLLPVALEGAVMAKLCAHFVGILFPVLATMPLAGLLLNIRPDTVAPMLATLLA